MQKEGFNCSNKKSKKKKQQFIKAVLILITGKITFNVMILFIFFS